MKTKKEYMRGPSNNRGHRVTSVNLDPAHYDVLKGKNLKVSEMVRDLLEEYLQNNFPVELKRAKIKNSEA